MISIFKVDIGQVATDLSTRPVGAAARTQLIELLNEHEAIEVDFHDKILTPSFADECIGRLAENLGLDEFKKRVSLVNVNASTRPLVKHVVLTRCASRS